MTIDEGKKPEEREKKAKIDELTFEPNLATPVHKRYSSLGSDRKKGIEFAKKEIQAGSLGWVDGSTRDSNPGPHAVLLRMCPKRESYP